MKLLIVDDASIVRSAIRAFLDQHGLEIVGQASDGKMAIELFKQTMPDVVTLDITMPEMDGLTCLVEMLKIKPETKIMVISALKDQATALDALQKGARSFLGKPFTSAELNESFQDLLAN